MKVYCIDGWVFIEVSENYMLAISSLDEWGKLDESKQIELITTTLAEFRFANMDTASVSVN